MKNRLLILSLLITAFAGGQSTTARQFIRDGNVYYKQQQFEKAIAAYDKAITADPSAMTARFNRANALYRLDRKVDAAQQYASLLDGSASKDILAKLYYNKGVILSQQKNLEESIESYKNALRNDPGDKEARENLQKALLELKKKNPPPKKEPKKNNKKQEQRPQNKMDNKEAEQRLKLLEQKEKEVQQRMQQEKSKAGGARPKDW